MSSRNGSQCLLLALLAGLFVARAQAGSESDARQTARPDILFILVDDLGWMDLRCQGNELVETPAIDGLARDGMRFTDAYAAAPVCSPTRAAILTGHAPARLRITNHISRQSFTPPGAKLLPAEMEDRLPLDAVTLAERVKAAGYRTGFFGKWHLAGTGAGDPAFHPEHQGFDVNVGGCAYGGPPTFFDPYRIPTIADRREGEYLPDRLADEAMRFVRESGEQPFLLCLWSYAVHWPMEAPAPLIEKYATRTGRGLNDTRYGAMIEALDRSLGRLLAELERLERAQKTLVVFASDNGGYSGVADNRPLREGKGYLYEGGIRVPLIVRWPGRVRGGSVCATPVTSTDLFPTILEAAGLALDPGTPCDGESLLPLLTERGTLERDAVFFHYPNYAFHKRNRLGSAIRAGRYKLIERFDDGSLELFDLEADLGETRNLAGELPQKAAELARRLRAWRRETGAAMPVPRPTDGD